MSSSSRLWFQEKANNSCLLGLLYDRLNKDNDEEDDGSGGAVDERLWSRGLQPFSLGEYSFAVVRGNPVIEDYSQAETGRNCSFFGVYDGHGGPDAAQFVCNNLFQQFKGIAEGSRRISEAVISNAVAATEEQFLNVVRERVQDHPKIVAIGSCCLVGVVWNKMLHIANLGDSRAVMGVSTGFGAFKRIVGEPLTRDHNVNVAEVRQELINQHRNDPYIVHQRLGAQDAWRIKGVIQVSRSIGDAHLKSPEFVLHQSIPQHQLITPLTSPAMSALPAMFTREIRQRDKFLILASDGLWEHLTNHEAANLVNKYPRAGIAERLIKKALTVAVRRHRLTYAELLNHQDRRSIHDDISVIVLFFDLHLLGNEPAVAGSSVRGFSNAAEPSDFSFLNGWG